MALATNAFTTYLGIGNREDLSDTIYRIDPSDTPFYSSIERERATATKHEWQTQALAQANPNNAANEGDDNTTPDPTTATVRLGNYTQIQVKIPRVTGTQDVVLHAGRGSEMDYQVMLKGLELKRDVEATLLANTAQTAGSSPSTPRLMSSVLSFIFTNTSFGAGGANPANATGTSSRTDGTQRPFTETLLKNVLQQIWFSGGKPDTILLGPFNKQVFSTFTGRGTPIQDQAEKTITAGVDLYQSDFGNLKAVPDRFLRNVATPPVGRDVLIIQTDLWAMAALNGRNFISFQLAKTGDTERRELLVEHTLVARNEKGSGGVFDLTTS